MQSGAPTLTRRCGQRWLLMLGALVLAAPVLQPARLEAAPGISNIYREVRMAIGKAVSKDLRGVCAARGNRPIWFDGGGNLSPAAHDLIDLMRNADLDGLDPEKLKTDRIADALDDASDGDPRRLAKAELALSGGYVRYVQALRNAPGAPMIYETQALAPVVPTAGSALQALAKAASPRDHIRTMAWMTPFYAPLRSALANGQLDPRQAATTRLNLARLRAIPPVASGRWVLIDAASARLWMFEGGRSVGTMKVVVGKPQSQTPEMAGFLRYAIVNPYWNMPDDLVPSRITDKVLANGPGYVAANRYQLLDSWDQDAALVDPRKVDWRAVAAGQQPIRVRQLPGAGNFMGAVKFMFPNPQGIYLHDTPERDLLTKPARQFSNGCVRLEDAQKFGRWVMGKPLPRGKAPETKVELPVIVPLYITYLTALPEMDRIAFRPDVYGRDRTLAVTGFARAR